MKSRILSLTVLSAAMLGTLSISASAASLGVMAKDQDVSGGTVTASKIMAGENGWLVVHRTDGMKPGPVIGHAPLKKGTNAGVSAILTEPVEKGDKLMLMLHSEMGGTKTGIFEYTLGAKEDGPVKVNDKLVMKVITAK